MKTLKKFVLIGLGLGMFAAVPSVFAQTVTTTGNIGSATTIYGSTINLTTPGAVGGQLITIGAQGSGQNVTIDGYGHMGVGATQGGSLAVGTGGLSTTGSTTLGDGGLDKTTINGSDTIINTTYTKISGTNTTVNTTTTNINSTDTQIGGAGKTVGVTGEIITVKGNTAIGGTGFNTTITGATTSISTSNTNINSASGVNISTSTLALTGSQTVTGSVTAANLYTGGMNVGNEIINLKDSVALKASAASVTNLTNTVETNRTTAATATAAVQGNLNATNANIGTLANNTVSNVYINGVDDTNSHNNIATGSGTIVDRIGAVASSTAAAINGTNARVTALEASDAAAVLEFNNYKASNNAAVDLKADKTQVTADIATAKGEAISAANVYTDGKVSTLSTTVTNNAATAAAATAQVQTNLTAEVTRAQTTEANLDNKIATTNANLVTETTRATQAEAKLDNKIGAETQRAQQAEAELRKETRQVGAMALAAAAAAGATPTGDKKSAVTMAVGTYGGQQAMSVGVVHMISERTKVFGSVSGAVTGGGTVGAAAGAAFSF